MTEENKKNKEALDTKMSSAFLFSEECYRNFSTIAFKNYKHRGFALYLMVKFYSPTKNGEDFIYFSSSKLRDIASKYKIILEKLVNSNIIQIIRTGSFKYVKNKNYVGNCKLSNEDMELYVNTCEYVKFKLYDRAIKSNTLNFTLDINDTEIEQELWEYEECNLTEEEELTLTEKINRQKYLIKELKKGNLNLSQYTNNRCYSNFSMLSSKFHKYFKIAGEDVVEIDSHATFISFLPLVCRRYIIILNENKEKYEKKLKNDPENDLFKNIIVKNIDLLSGLEDCIVRFENKLKELFENKLSFYDYLQDNIVKKYDSCSFKKIVNSFLMSKKQYKVNKDIHDYFLLNYPEICKLINNMRPQNYYWREAEKIEVSIFTNSAREIKENSGHCLTKYDGILVQESLKNNLISLLYTNFKKNGIHTIFKVIEHKTKNTFKLSLNEAQDIHEEFYKDSRDKILNNCEQARIPSGSTSDVCPDKKKKCIYRSKNKEGRGGHIDTSISLSGQNTRNRMINMKFTKDGRMSVSVKNVKYVSKKNDTLEDFKNSVLSKIDKEYENLIIWTVDERSECRVEEPTIKSLTTEIKETILKKDEKTVDLSLEVDFSQDVVEMGNDTKIPQNAPEEAKNNQSDVNELSDTIKLIIGVK